MKNVDKWTSIPRKDVEEAAEKGNDSARKVLKKASYYNNKENYNIEFFSAGNSYKVKTNKFDLFD